MHKLKKRISNLEESLGLIMKDVTRLRQLHSNELQKLQYIDNLNEFIYKNGNSSELLDLNKTTFDKIVDLHKEINKTGHHI